VVTFDEEPTKGDGEEGEQENEKRMMKGPEEW